MESFKSPRFWGYIVAVAAAECVFVSIFEGLKPGVGVVWSRIISVISFGSSTLRDLPYSMAALNPYPVPSLLFMYGVPFLPVLAVIYMVLDSEGRRRARLNTEQWMARELSNEEREKDLERLVKTTKKYQAMAIVASLALFVQLQLMVTITKHAIYAREIYEADRDVVRPFFESDQLAKIQAEFVAIQTKADYRAVMQKIGMVAAVHHLKLRIEDDEFSPEH